MLYSNMQLGSDIVIEYGSNTTTTSNETTTEGTTTTTEGTTSTTEGSASDTAANTGSGRLL